MKFKHYKGGEYELVTLATDEETNEPLVVYKALSDGTVWSRPASVFFERRKEGGQRFEIQLPPGQALTCDAGCDSPRLRVEAFEFSREEDAEGLLISSRSKPVWACRCGEEIHIYHEIDGSETELDEQPYERVDFDAMRAAGVPILNGTVKLGNALVSSGLAELIEGMEVSVDVSTCDEDAGHRVFGKVTEAMDHPEGKNGVILLVQSDVQPNFAPSYETFRKWAATKRGAYWSNATPEQAAEAAWDAARETK
jgi:hypothetical protein